jgi:hypothetical protein
MAHGRMAGGGVNYAIFTLIDGLSLTLWSCITIHCDVY